MSTTEERVCVKCNQTFIVDPAEERDFCPNCESKIVLGRSRRPSPSGEGDSQSARPKFAGMPVATTDVVCVPGFTVIKQFSVITVNRIYGVNLIKEALAGINDLFGGRVVRFERIVNDIQADLLAEIQEQAGSIGANAVVGYRVQISNLSGGNTTMLTGMAYGTPILLRKIPVSDEPLAD